MSFATGKRFDVIITILKTVKLCNVMFRVPQVCKRWGSENFFARYACKIVPPPSKLWRCPCQGETMKVKYVYNRLTGENEGAAKSNLAPPPKNCLKMDAPRLHFIERFFLAYCKIQTIFAVLLSCHPSQ